MKMVVIATNNKNKVREFKSILNTNKIEFKTLSEIGYDKDIVEDGKSFKENAIIKARTIALELNTIAISDDSGLECLGLNNEPGIYSARYAGTHNDDDNNSTHKSTLVLLKVTPNILGIWCSLVVSIN